MREAIPSSCTYGLRNCILIRQTRPSLCLVLFSQRLAVPWGGCVSRSRSCTKAPCASTSSLATTIDRGDYRTLRVGCRRRRDVITNVLRGGDDDGGVGRHCSLMAKTRRWGRKREGQQGLFRPIKDAVSALEKTLNLVLDCCRGCGSN